MMVDGVGRVEKDPTALALFKYDMVPEALGSTDVGEERGYESLEARMKLSSNRRVICGSYRVSSESRMAKQLR